MQYDFLAIGDTTTDAFIRLEEASVHCDVNRERCEICMKFADKIPYEDVFVIPAVGNSANAAIAAARLGLRSALVANIGNDRHGKECLAVFKKEGVSTKFVQVHRNIKTNYHYVLWYEDDRTILVKHEKYTYLLPKIGEPKWIYLSSMGGDADNLYPIIGEYLKAHPAVKLAFQPGTYQMKLGVEKLRDIYTRTELFFCNKEEAQRILSSKGGSPPSPGYGRAGASGGNAQEEDMKKLLGGVRALGPKIVVITDGPKGAYANNGLGQWFMPPYPDPKPPYERTGAGDAFSSAFTAAIILGLPVVEALRWAPVNSMSVVQYVGAREGLLTREKIEEYLKSAPSEYMPKSLT